MFDSIKIITECKKVLNPYNIDFCEDFKIHKKMGLIHCYTEDWRGNTEVDGFPVFTTKAAIELLVKSCAFEHYSKVEVKDRENLKKEYPLVYGEYEPRKFVFENILNVLKDYDRRVYENNIKKYTKYINTNRKPKSEWIFNTKTNSFETCYQIDSFAVVIYKTAECVKIYNQDPCGGRPFDNFYKLLSSSKSDNILTYIFTNNGDDRFYLNVYNPRFGEKTEDYIIVGSADKIVWTHAFKENNLDKKQTKTFVLDGNAVNISEDTTDY